MATTLDPAHLSAATLSNGNLTIVTTGTNGQSISTTSRSTGKYHLEFTVNAAATGANLAMGVCNSSHNVSGYYCGQNTFSIGLWSGLRSQVTAAFSGSNYATLSNCGWTAGDTVVFEFDFAAQLVWFQNLTAGYNQWNGSSTANPATGVGGLSFSQVTGPYFFVANPYSSTYGVTVNFGATAFALAPSSGFQPWDGSVSLDPAHTYQGTLSNGNLTLTSSATNGMSWSTTTKSTGKWHVEVTLGSATSSTFHNFGISSSNALITGGMGTDALSVGIGTGVATGANAVVIYNNNALKQNFTAGGAGANQTMAVEYDFDAQLLWFQASGAGQWNNSGTANPATGTGGINFSTWVTKGLNFYFGINPYTSGYVETVNFGATAFAVTPSSGFQAWQGAATAPVTTKAAALMIGV